MAINAAWLTSFDFQSDKKCLSQLLEYRHSTVSVYLQVIQILSWGKTLWKHFIQIAESWCYISATEWRHAITAALTIALFCLFVCWENLQFTCDAEYLSNAVLMYSQCSCSQWTAEYVCSVLFVLCSLFYSFYHLLKHKVSGLNDTFCLQNAQTLTKYCQKCSQNGLYSSYMPLWSMLADSNTKVQDCWLKSFIQVH